MRKQKSVSWSESCKVTWEKNAIQRQLKNWSCSFYQLELFHWGRYKKEERFVGRVCSARFNKYPESRFSYFSVLHGLLSIEKIWRPKVHQSTVLKVSCQPRYPAESMPYFSDPSGRWACPLCLPAVLLVPHLCPLIHYSSVSLSPNQEHRNAPNISECCAVLNCTGRVGVRVTEEDHDQVSYCVSRSGCSTESKLFGTQLGQIQMMSFLQQTYLDLSAKVGFMLYSFFGAAFIYIWGLVFLLAHWYI